MLSFLFTGMHFWFNIKGGKRVWMTDLCSMRSSVFPDSFFDSNNLDTVDKLGQLLPPDGATLNSPKVRENKEKNGETCKDKKVETNKDGDINEDNEKNVFKTENLKKSDENQNEMKGNFLLGKENEKKEEHGDIVSQNDLRDGLGSTVETQKGSYVRLSGTGMFHKYIRMKGRNMRDGRRVTKCKK